MPYYRHMESMDTALNISRMETVHGPYVVITQPNGRLLPEAETLLREAVLRSGADLLYADAEIVQKKGAQPVYKPDFSPDTLLSYNYVGSPLMLSERLWTRVKGCLDAENSIADQQYALTVRAMLLAERVEHLPHILFSGDSPPMPAKKAAILWGLSALGRQGAVGAGRLQGSFAVRYAIQPRGTLSVIVRTNGDADALRRTLEAFELRSTCLDYEFVIAAGGILTEREAKYCDALRRYRAAKVCVHTGETNDARIKNLAAAEAGGEYLLFLEAGVEPDGPDTAERLISHAQQRRAGAVGGVMQTEDGTLLQTEMVVDAEDCPRLRKTEQETGVEAGSTKTVPDACVRNVTLLGGGAFLLRTDVFLESGGFDETFDCCFCEPALALSLSQRHLFNVCTPYARFVHKGMRRAGLSRRNRERCGDIFRALRVHGDPMRSRNAALIAKSAAQEMEMQQ